MKEHDEPTNAQTNVPDIRLRYRNETLLEELHLVCSSNLNSTNDIKHNTLPVTDEMIAAHAMAKTSRGLF